MIKRFVLNVLALTMFGAFAVATVAGVLSFAQQHDVTAEHMSFGKPTNPKVTASPAPKGKHTWKEVDTRTPLAKLLQVQDCPAEDSMDMICVWDAHNRGNGKGEPFVLVFGEVFKVGFNDDGTVWVDYNHDGEEGYPDA